MQKNSFEILKNFKKSDIKKLGDFIKSPYFNSSEKLIKFYELIAKKYPGYESNLEDNFVYKKIFPGKDFNRQILKNLYWEFGVLLDKFLAFEEMILKKDLIELNLAESLKKRKYYKLSKKLIENYRKNKESSIKLNEDDLYYLYKMEKINQNNILHSRPIDRQEIFDSLNSESENFILFSLNMFYSLSYKLSLTSITRYNEANNKKIKDFFETSKGFTSEELVKYINSSKNNYAPALKLRYLFYHYTTANISDEEYSELKDIFLKNIHNFSKDDLLEFFKAIIEIILLKLVATNPEYLKEAFELRKLFCELKIYPDDSIPPFSAAMLQNSLIVAMGLKEFEWAEEFINEYINYIDEDLRENEYNYSMGLLSFRRKKYEKSLEYLNKVKYSQILEKVNVRFYYVMNYIELKSYDAASSMVASIKQFHRENKEIPAMTSKFIIDSIRYFNEIIKCQQDNIKMDSFLYTQAQENNSFFHSTYILEKMKTLI